MILEIGKIYRDLGRGIVYKVLEINTFQCKVEIMDNNPKINGYQIGNIHKFDNDLCKNDILAHDYMALEEFNQDLEELLK